MVWRGGLSDDSYRVISKLNQEWELLSAQRGEVAQWATRHRELEGCGDLAGVLAAVSGDPDVILGALLRESRDGSSTAARTVLQAMLGKIVLMARADSRVGVDGFLVAMWECIRSYPVDRRPLHVAANLALDARKLARNDCTSVAKVVPWAAGASFADVVDRQRARETADHAGDIAVLTAGDVIRAALELELIDAAAGALLGSVYADGLSSSEAAGRHSTTANMVRQRCSRAVRHLAKHSDEIASYA